MWSALNCWQNHICHIPCANMSNFQILIWRNKIKWKTIYHGTKSMYYMLYIYPIDIGKLESKLPLGPIFETLLGFDNETNLVVSHFTIAIYCRTVIGTWKICCDAYAIVLSLFNVYSGKICRFICLWKLFKYHPHLNTVVSVNIEICC